MLRGPLATPPCFLTFVAFRVRFFGEGFAHEENFSTTCTKKNEDTRISRKEKQRRRQEGSEEPHGERKDLLDRSAVEEVGTDVDSSFPGTYRLKTTSEFDGVMKYGKRHHSTHFTLYFKRNSLGHARLGMIVSRKRCGNAVRRNRIKRLVREVFRQNKPLFDSLDLVVLAEKDSHLLDCNSALEELKPALANL